MSACCLNFDAYPGLETGCDRKESTIGYFNSAEVVNVQPSQDSDIDGNNDDGSCSDPDIPIVLQDQKAASSNRQVVAYDIDDLLSMDEVDFVDEFPEWCADPDWCAYDTDANPESSSTGGIHDVVPKSQRWAVDDGVWIYYIFGFHSPEEKANIIPKNNALAILLRCDNVICLLPRPLGNSSIRK